MIISFMLLPTLASCIDKSQLLKDYNGEILMLYPDLRGGYHEACNLIYTPKNNKYLYINEGNGISDVSFSEDKDKILGLDGDFLIVEYDLKSNSSIVVFKGDEEKEASYDYVKYVPKSDCISFVAYPNLYIFNRKTKERKLVTQADGEYAWSEDGKMLFYSKTGENKVYCLNMESKKFTLYIDNGYDPQLSPSNDYIVFKKDGGRLAIREIKTGKEWFYKSPLEIYYYKFSPDNKHLAIMELTPKDKSFNKTSLTGWDFRNNQKVALIRELLDGAYSNFDWK
ncbi:MAG TPA: hypothetical protein DDW65_15520 [Firmicutes bacterium]|jgi:WD40 repeat protein|nr:hypothetical protein [Bacillota bacterium]